MELNHAALEGKKRPNVKMLISRISSQRSDGISLPVKCANNGITRSASDYNRNLCDWCMHARGRKKTERKKRCERFKKRAAGPSQPGEGTTASELHLMLVSWTEIQKGSFIISSLTDELSVGREQISRSHASRNHLSLSEDKDGADKVTNP